MSSLIFCIFVMWFILCEVRIPIFIVLYRLTSSAAASLHKFLEYGTQETEDSLTM